MENKIKAFSTLGKFLKQFDSVSFMEDPSIAEINSLYSKKFDLAIREAELFNPWFTQDFIRYSFSSISEMLQEVSLRNWLAQYPIVNSKSRQKMKIGLIMAGNIPLVGFHDLLTVCFSGHQGVVKMSSKDEKLLPLILRILSHCDNSFNESVTLVNHSIKNIDAIIATGSNNSSRYFEYYFGKYPHIIRKTRNSVAILTGDETDQEFKNLADDIFLYFGMGCRNVSKIFLPRDFNIPRMLDNFESYSYLYNHNKYANNYDYHKAIYLVNIIKHLDTGYLILKEDPEYSSPVGVLYYEYYDSVSELKSRIEKDDQQIQCLVCRNGQFGKAIGFGMSQRPGLNDYADYTDTFKFLLNLYK